jgi:predicted dehydrogenase
MRIGVCGVRGLGVDFQNLFALHPEVESVSIADLDPEVRAKAVERVPGTEAFKTLDELLDADVDCIGVFTPPWTHAELAVRALDAGKHVVSACPAGLTLDELRSLVDAVKRTGKIYMMAETSYYYPGAMFARQAWAEGRFGDFVYGEGEYYYRPHAYDFWMRDEYGNMPPMLYPTHSTTMVISITGKRYERVTCVGTPGLHSDVEPMRRREEWKENQYSNMTMLGQMSGGGVCRINEMRNVGCKGELASLFGKEGSIRQHDDRGVDERPFWRRC